MESRRYREDTNMMIMEIILAWLWLIGIVAFVVLVGWLLQARRDEPFSHGSYCLKYRPLPNYLELFRQRRRQPHPKSKRLSRLG